MQFKRVFAAAVATGTLLAASANAGANLITDGGFENGGPAPGATVGVNIGSKTISGWTVINNDGSTNDNAHDIIWIGNPDTFNLNTPFGTVFLDLTGYSDRPTFDGVTQSVGTAAGQSYELSFYLGAQPSSAEFGGPISATASAGSISQTFLDPGTTGVSAGPAGSETFWTLETLDFTATSNTTNIAIIGQSGAKFIGLDNVSLVANAVSAAPEPSTWALMFAGVAMVGAALRLGRRQQRAALAR